MTIKSAIYTRLSKDEDNDELGISRQLEACTALASRLGWEVTATYTDNDVSAYSGAKRPGFEALLQAVSKREFDALIVWHVDRLYRSMKDLERVIDVAEVAGIKFETVNSGNFDLSTSAGKMIARILGSVARQESEHHAERRREANAQRRAAGVFNKEGFRVFGYTSDGKPLEPEASAVRQAAKDVLNGKSLRSIAIEWTARDTDWCGLCARPHSKCAKSDVHRRGLSSSRGKQWSNLTLRRMLMNPTYASLVTYGTNGRKTIVGPGKWKPLIDTDTHYGLVAFLTDETRRPAISFERKHMGSGVYICGHCGTPTLYGARPYGAKRPVTYVCRQKAHLGRLAAPLDAYIEGIVLKMLRGSDINARLAKASEVDIDALHTERAALIAQKDQLATWFTAGVLDGPAVERESAKLSARIAGINQTLAEAVQHSPAAQLLEGGVDELQEHWDECSPDIKGKIVNELMVVTVLPTHGRRGVDRSTGLIVPEFVKVQERG